MKRKFVDYKKLYSDTRAMLDKVGLKLDPRQRVRGLNSGQMQMVSIARALSKHPRIVVLDDGKAVGIGTHAELMKTCEVYRDIALSQLSQAELEEVG